MLKFISWNVNGLRACVGKDFENQFKELDADFSVCRKPRCKKVSSTWRLKDTTATGTMLRKRIFWDCYLYQASTIKRKLWYGSGRARP